MGNMPTSKTDTGRSFDLFRAEDCHGIAGTLVVAASDPYATNVGRLQPKAAM